jgi:hypothetical protein
MERDHTLAKSAVSIVRREPGLIDLGKSSGVSGDLYKFFEYSLSVVEVTLVARDASPPGYLGAAKFYIGH